MQTRGFLGGGGLPVRFAMVGTCDATIVANATTTTRHALLHEHLIHTVGRADATADVLVLNTIDKHYIDIIGAWKAMVDAAKFPKRIFVVAMDAAAGDACASIGVAHYLPLGHPLDACTGATTASRGTPTPQPGTYHRIKVQGKEADTRVLPPDLPSWKMHAVLAGLSAGWRVLFSESDVVWLPGMGRQLFEHLLAPTADPFDFAPQRHPMTPVWNFGFFLGQGAAAAAFFECVVRRWELKHLSARLEGKHVDIGSDQRFLWDLWRRRSCGALRVRKLPLGLYPTCRDVTGQQRLELPATRALGPCTLPRRLAAVAHALVRLFDVAPQWVGRRDALVVHVTYCHKLSMLLSAEDECKKRVLDAFYHQSHAQRRLGGFNVTSAAWNKRMGC